MRNSRKQMHKKRRYQAMAKTTLSATVTKEFKRVRRKFQATSKKLGRSYTEEQIFKIVS